MESVFRQLPQNFFSPLASPNRSHYAELLLVFYRLFMEYHRGVEREVVVAAFEEYFGALENAEKVFSIEENGETAGETETDSGKDRSAASFFLRRLLSYGWMNEEELADFSRLINISTAAKPFFEALYSLSKGLEVEYESHIVAIYSSLVSDSAEENGEHAVLNAHYHTRLLIESLKVLEQNIRGYIQSMYDNEAEVKDILHVHYDIYMNEVVDRAYTRLKTSDNLSKYRPKIIRSVNDFLKNSRWLSRNAEKLAVIRRIPVAQAEETLAVMLKEIRDDLKSIDPILDRIDDKNRKYSRISTERIKTQLYSDSTLQGKIGKILKAWNDPTLPSDLKRPAHRLLREHYTDKGSLYTKPVRKEETVETRPHENDDFAIEEAETELRLRIANQLNPDKIADFLSAFCTEAGVAVPAEKMISDMETFVKTLYAAAYAESRTENFPFSIRWEDGNARLGRFVFTRHSFIRRYPND